MRSCPLHLHGSASCVLSVMNLLMSIRVHFLKIFCCVQHSLSAYTCVGVRNTSQHSFTDTNCIEHYSRCSSFPLFCRTPMKLACLPMTRGEIRDDEMILSFSTSSVSSWRALLCSWPRLLATLCSKKAEAPRCRFPRTIDGPSLSDPPWKTAVQTALKLLG